jgi:flavin-dependent dehydrogenase
MRHDAFAPLLEDGLVRGFRIRAVGADRPAFEVRPRLVIAADGRRSVLARRLGPDLCDPTVSSPESWFGLKIHLSADAARLDGRVELHLFDGGYVGLGAVEGERINACLLVTVRALRACGGSPDRLLRERVMANPAVSRLIADAPPCGRWQSVGPLRWGVRRPEAGGAVFLGDAAGTIDPFSGEGMSNAMRSAEIALPHVLNVLEGGELNDEIRRAYAADWTRAFAPVTRRVRRVGRLFESPWLAGAAIRLMAGVGSPWLSRLIASTRTGS